MRHPSAFPVPGRRPSRLLWLGCSALLAYGCRCGPVGPADGGEGDGGGPLEVVLETSGAVSARVDLGVGATLSASSSTGAGFTLAIPPQEGRQAPVQVSLTPVAEVRGFPAGVALVAGLQLEPEGLILRPPAVLTIAPPAPVDALDAFAFAYAQRGEDLHLVPHPDWPTTATQLQLAVPHFSGTGLALGVASALDAARATAAFNPAAAAARLEQQVAALVARALRSGVLPWYDAQSRADFSALMIQAFEDWVRPALNDAAAKVQTSLHQPCDQPRPAALDATAAAVRTVLSWAVPLSIWSDEVFPPRHTPPPDWAFARTASQWSGRYADIGLDPRIDALLTEAVASLNKDIGDGPQDEACRRLGSLEVCRQYECLEVAASWASELNAAAGTLAPGATVEEVDLDAYCGGLIASYARELMVLPRYLELTVGDTAQLQATALGGSGAPLDVQPPVTWTIADPSVASVSSVGQVTAQAPGWTSVVITGADSCRFATVDVYVYLPDFTMSGRADFSCTFSNECGCGQQGQPPACVAFVTRRQGGLRLEVSMRQRQVGFTAQASWQETTACANGDWPQSASGSASWAFGHSPWDDQNVLIEAWQFGSRGSLHFNYDVSRNTAGTWAPLSFHGNVGAGPSAQVLVFDDPICNSQFPLGLQ